MEAEWERRLVRGWLLCMAEYVRWESESRGNVESREKQLMDGSAVSVEQLFTVNVRYSKALRRWSTEINSSIDTSSSSMRKKEKKNISSQSLWQMLRSLEFVIPYSLLMQHPSVPSILLTGSKMRLPSFKTAATTRKMLTISSDVKPTVSNAFCKARRAARLKFRNFDQRMGTMWLPWCCRSPPYRWAILGFDSTAPCASSYNSRCSSAASTILP